MKYLKFEASWCGACKMIEPQIRKVKEAGVNVEKIDAESNNEMVMKYNIRNLPTIILVDNSGKEFYRNAGSRITTQDMLNTYQQFTNG